MRPFREQENRYKHKN